MCGIAGYVAAANRVVRSDDAELLSRLLRHRGPDDHGFLTMRGGAVRVGRDRSDIDAEADLCLVHRRLSILDLSPTGWNPMSTPDRRYWIIFNGEVYNYVELREELQRLGHVFRGTSDTEVVLAAYAEWGKAALPKFVGMFAFAILDTTDRKLFLARDFFGIKPLYYCRPNGGFAFASEIKALLPLGVSRRADPESLYLYLRHSVTDSTDQTLLADVKELKAAHWMEVDLRDLSSNTGRYWELKYEPTLDISFQDATNRVRDLFMESVAFHLRSDVPVGAALSGGIDSTSIVMAMRRIVGAKLDIHTFSYIATGGFSEEKWIDLVNRESKATVHKVHLQPGELIDDLEEMVGAHDLPFASTSQYAQYRVFRLVQQSGIKVTVDGQGADELLGGYRPFPSIRFASALRSGDFGTALRVFRGAQGRPDVGANLMVKWSAEHLLPKSMQSPFRAMVGKGFFPQWMNRDWFRSHDVIARGFYGNGNGNGSKNLLRKALHAATTDNVLPALLRFEDRNSMHHSVESRVPFLTPQLATFIMSLPESYIVSDKAESKSVFRAAMRGIIPDAILDRRDKVGFATPESDWFSQLQPWIGTILTHAPEVPVVDAQGLRKELLSMSRRKKPFHFGIWRSLNLIAWARANGVVF